jgi:hypothetical protein
MHAAARQASSGPTMAPNDVAAGPSVQQHPIMKVWSTNALDNGLFTAMVGPTTLPELAVALDPEAPFVLLSDHTPVAGGWHEVLVPFTARQGLQPVRATVRRLSFDVLLDTAAFLRLVPDLAQFGATVWQFCKRPRADTHFDDPRPGPRAAKYRAHGLTVSIELPHAHEVAMLTCVGEAELQAALTRIARADR